MTRSFLLRTALLSAALWPAFSQPASQKAPKFDAASVKRASLPPGASLLPGGIAVPRGSAISIPPNTGGPGTSDPGRIHYPYITVGNLLKRAYNSYFKIEGPGWLESELVAVDATLAPNSTTEDFRQMLRSLIVDRFGLKFHVETREGKAYILSVAKGGPKMKESVIVPMPDGLPSPLPKPVATDAFGLPVFPSLPQRHWHGEMRGAGNAQQALCQWCSMSGLANDLGVTLGAVVTDATGLAGLYDYKLTFADPAMPDTVPAPSDSAVTPAPDILTALQSQLGLKLDRTKATTEVMVIDRVEKTPIEN